MDFTKVKRFFGHPLGQIAVMGALVLGPLAAFKACSTKTEPRLEERVEIAIDESEKFSLIFKTPENYAMAAGVMDMYEKFKNEKYGPAARLYFGHVMDANKANGVSAEEIAEYRKPRKWSASVKPATVSGDKIDYSSPVYVYDSKSDKERMHTLIERQAAMQRVENDPVWQVYVKEWVATEYNAPKDGAAIKFTKEIVDKYDKQVKTWEGMK